MKKTSLSIVIIITALLSPIVRAQSAADTTPPENMVKAPIVTAVGNGSVSLSWDVLKDNVAVVKYKVYYGTQSFVAKNANTNSTASFDQSQTTTETKLTISNLQNGQHYYFTVTAVDAAGNESEYITTEAQATPTVAVVPSSSPSANPVSTSTSSPLPAYIPPTPFVILPVTTPLPAAANAASGPSFSWILVFSILTASLGYTLFTRKSKI